MKCEKGGVLEWKLIQILPGQQSRPKCDRPEKRCKLIPYTMKKTRNVKCEISMELEEYPSVPRSVVVTSQVKV